jgi:acyl-CoA oxidase
MEDLGHKLGLNGVDNARIKFTHLRIPREALLNKNSDVDVNGVFTSSIKKKRDRFLKVADRLLSGRICIVKPLKTGFHDDLRHQTVLRSVFPFRTEQTSSRLKRQIRHSYRKLQPLPERHVPSFGQDRVSERSAEQNQRHLCLKHHQTHFPVHYPLVLFHQAFHHLERP